MTIGVLTIVGPNFDVNFDNNDLGLVSQGASVSGTVAFDNATGRGTLSVPGGYNNHFFNSNVFYQYDSGKAFIIDADPSTCVPTACNPPLPPALTVTNIGASGTLIRANVNASVRRLLHERRSHGEPAVWLGGIVGTVHSEL